MRCWILCVANSQKYNNDHTLINTDDLNSAAQSIDMQFFNQNETNSNTQ